MYSIRNECPAIRCPLCLNKDTALLKFLYANVFLLLCSSPVHLLPAVWPQSGRPLSTWDRPHLQDWQGKVSVVLCSVHLPYGLPYRCCHAVICISSCGIALIVSCFDLYFTRMSGLYIDTMKFCFMIHLF